MKSHVSALTEVAACLLNDAAAKCTVEPLVVRDLDTLRKRVKHEGLSFLTITLPTLGSDLEKALDQGRIGSAHFRSFRKRGKAPAFMQGFFSQVFDVSTGRIYDKPDVAAIEGIREVAYAFKKLRVDCHPDRVRRALRKFIEIEHDFEVYKPSPGDQRYFRSVARVLWGTTLAAVEQLDSYTPKHGPGATAERVHGNAKYKFERWHDRLEPYFPLFHYAFSSESAYGSREFEKVTVVTEEEEQPVRVVTVPKTLKGPRIIAIEPVCMQYTQQAISRSLVEALETSPLTRGHVNFRDQYVNKYLAIMSSKDGRLATLDLSSASDRVPYATAADMFLNTPNLWGAIDACRSRSAQMPDSGEVIPLQKFASMGSALCFPIEAMYFYTICIVALLKKHELPVTYENIFTVSRDVYVYGDDILVPTDAAVTVADYLQKYNCKVNTDKSFWTGKFRESCGMDAYDGEEVTPTYIRTMPPSNRRTPEALVSWVASSNLFYRKGYWRTSSHMLRVCEAIIGTLPVVGNECAGLGKETFQRWVSSERFSTRYHRHEVKTWVARPVYRTDKLDGFHALTKCLLELETPLSPGVEKDSKHLIRSARHGAVALQRRWIPPV